MIIEIECFEGDTLLFGKVRSVAELKKQLAHIEAIYDKTADHFIALLCRNYQWTVLKPCEEIEDMNDRKIQARYEPDYTYDRDTKTLFKNIR